MHTDPYQVKLDAKVKVIMSQTNYTKEKALEKLNMPQFNFEAISVIRDYMDNRTTSSNVRKSEIISPNQEMFKQMRSHYNEAISDYEARTEAKEAAKKAI